MRATGFLTLAFALSGPAGAVDFQVNSALDQIDDDVADGLCHTAAGTCTLRAAVMQANRISGAGANIYLPAGTYTLTRPAAGANGDDNGDLNLTTPASGNPVLQLIGAGAEATVIDANQLDRAVRIDPGRTANLSDLTLRNGLAVADSGGALKSRGVSTLTRVTIRDNQAEIYGGGIYFSGGAGIAALSIVESTIVDNGAGSGGGLRASGRVTLERSTFSGNSAEYGGGLQVVLGGDISMINSTISSNRARFDGGGVEMEGATIVNVYSSTIAFNQADSDFDDIGDAGGIANQGGTLNLRNSLLAANYVTTQLNPDDCTGTLGSYGRNLFGDVAGCNVVIGSGSWDFLNDPGYILPLAYNGGPTRTHALYPGSNAIAGGDPVDGCQGPTGLLVTDQRGAPRYFGNFCDIGAFEFGSWIFLDGFESGGLSAWIP